MALVGYQVEKERIEAKIRELQAKLKGKVASMPATATNPAGVKRILSPAARKRIATAQKKRWAEHRKRVAQEAKQA
jgi:cell division septum initiation protein DivIVA